MVNKFVDCFGYSSLRARRRDIGLMKIFRASAYFGHLMMRFTLHVLHTWVGSLEMRKKWVR